MSTRKAHFKISRNKYFTKMAAALLIFLAFGFVSGLPKSLQPRIIGGIEADKGEFPHIVLLRVGGGIYCAGSIVSEDWVVTAGHCADASWWEYSVVAGEHDVTIDEGTEQFRNVSTILLHPNYDPSTFANDIALVSVSRPFIFDDYVGAAKLPNSSFTPASILTVAGWGHSSLGGPYATALMKIDVPIVDQETCREGLGGDLPEGMICAGEEGKDPCEGDNGGPLLSGDILAGLVTWGWDCAMDRYPGVYPEVAPYTSWILSNIQ